jgi:hypothetical protein
MMYLMYSCNRTLSFFATSRPTLRDGSRNDKMSFLVPVSCGPLSLVSSIEQASCEIEFWKIDY